MNEPYWEKYKPLMKRLEDATNTEDKYYSK